LVGEYDGCTEMGLFMRKTQRQKGKRKSQGEKGYVIHLCVKEKPKQGRIKSTGREEN